MNKSQINFKEIQDPKIVKGTFLTANWKKSKSEEVITKESLEKDLLNFSKSGNIQQIRYLFDKFFDHPGFCINCRDDKKNTPLILAAKQGHGEVIEELLTYSPDITLENEIGETVMHVATNVIRKKIFESVSPCSKFSQQSFCNACWLGNLEIVNRYLTKDKNKISEDISNTDGMRCAILAVKHLSMLESASEGAKYQYKPAQVIECLLNHFPNILKDQNNILHILSKKNCRNSVDMAKILLRRSVDPYVQDEFGLTPLHYAARSGNTLVLKLFLSSLKSKNAEELINSSSREGNTPLHLASMEGREDCVKSLLENGANKHLVNSSHMTPLQVAKSIKIKHILNMDKSEPSEENLEIARGNTTIVQTPLSRGESRGRYSALPNLGFPQKSIIVTARRTDPRSHTELDFPIISDKITMSQRPMAKSTTSDELDPTRRLCSSLEVSHTMDLEPSHKISTQSKQIKDKLFNSNINKCDEGKTCRKTSKPNNSDIPAPTKSKSVPTINKSQMKKKKTIVKKKSPIQRNDRNNSTAQNYDYESDFEEVSQITQKSDLKLEEIKTEDDILSDEICSSAESTSSCDHQLKWLKGDHLGKGSYGTVWKGILESGKHIAVKEICIQESDDLCDSLLNNTRDIKREIEILRTLKHKNIVRYIGACDSETYIHIFMEFVSGGSIAQLLVKFNGFTESIIKNYTRQLVDAVQFLCQMNIIHRDIKGANVMVTPKGVVKLIDFGCAKKIQNISSASLSKQQQSKLQGSVYWLAPEIINGMTHTHKSDVWSLGCTVYEMIVTKPPWSDLHAFAAMYAIGTGNKPLLKLVGFKTIDGSTISDVASSFVDFCLERDKTKRPDAAELRQHAFLK